MKATEHLVQESLPTLVIGALGALCFWLIGFPAAVLTGPAVCVSMASLLGLRMSVPPFLRDGVFLILGVQIGSTVTPEAISTAVALPLSFAVLTVTLVLVLLAGRAVLIRVFAYDRMTAVLAAAPGHLSYVLGLAIDMRADVPKLALVQTIRVVMLTVFVPVLIAVWGVEGAARLTDQGGIAPWMLMLVLAMAWSVGQIFKRVGLPAPLLMGAMAVSGVGHGTDLTPGSLPTWMTLAAFVCMGTLIGTRFRGISRNGLSHAFLAGIVTTVIACAVAAAGAWIASGFVGLAPAALLLAFAPGGVEVMAAIAAETGLEPAFVAAHHVFRLFALSLMIPFFVVRERKS